MFRSIKLFGTHLIQNIWFPRSKEQLLIPYDKDISICFNIVKVGRDNNWSIFGITTSIFTFSLLKNEIVLYMKIIKWYENFQILLLIL